MHKQNQYLKCIAAVALLVTGLMAVAVITTGGLGVLSIGKVEASSAVHLKSQQLTQHLRRLWGPEQVLRTAETSPIKCSSDLTMYFNNGYPTNCPEGEECDATAADAGEGNPCRPAVGEGYERRLWGPEQVLRTAETSPIKCSSDLTMYFNNGYPTNCPEGEECDAAAADAGEGNPCRPAVGEGYERRLWGPRWGRV